MKPSRSALLPLIALALALLAPSPARGVASEWSENPESRVRLITPWLTAPRDGEMWMGLHFKLSPGWHVYWKNSGDAGFPPVVTFKPAEILGKPELLWPAPHRYDLPGDLVAFGYEKEVVYPVRAQILTTGKILPAPTDPAEGDAPPGGDVLWITAELDYLVCEVDCIPYRYTLTVEQPIGDVPLADPETAPLLETWGNQLPLTVAEAPGVSTGAVLDASQPGQPRLEVRILGAKGEPGKTELFLEAHEALDAERPRMRVTPDGLVFHVPMKQREAGKALPDRTPVAWTVTNLTGQDGRPFSLEAKRDIQVWKEAGAAPDPLAKDAGQTPAGSMPRMLLWAFLGGALLNLMPTVLALFAGEAFVLRGAEAEGGRSKVREGAAAAACGTVGGAWAVAALSLLAGRSGWPAGWGAQLQEPIVGALFTVASVVLALNLWGLIDSPLAAPGRPGGTGRHLLAGLFTVPLALVWPVPLLQESAGFAFSRGPAAVGAVFALIGFGLALPYLILTLVPAAVRLLPEPGAWLARLREGLGFLAAGGVFWLLYALSRQVTPEGLAWIQLTLLAMGLLAWLRHREGTRKLSKVVLALGLALCAAGALWLADQNRLAPRQEEPTTGLPQTAREPRSSQTSGG
ncbi:MAG TPA: protein-disulfide reductase DsbD domain-containing protein [Thermoanaerobaculia bacterium]|nr:protein-disulfide reductase DsbD domain-containing protein [Thermoanaerobaculia bacterium]